MPFWSMLSPSMRPGAGAAGDCISRDIKSLILKGNDGRISEIANYFKA
jgi:hypothetical protein